MGLTWGGSSKDRELALLRRRVQVLEQQVAALARFSGMDPGHLSRLDEPLSDEVQRLALHGRRSAAVRAQQAATRSSLPEAAEDVDAFLAHHEAV